MINILWLAKATPHPFCCDPSSLWWWPERTSEGFPSQTKQRNFQWIVDEETMFTAAFCSQTTSFMRKLTGLKSVFLQAWWHRMTFFGMCINRMDFPSIAANKQFQEHCLLKRTVHLNYWFFFHFPLMTVYFAVKCFQWNYILLKKKSLLKVLATCCITESFFLESDAAFVSFILKCCMHHKQTSTHLHSINIKDRYLKIWTTETFCIFSHNLRSDPLTHYYFFRRRPWSVCEVQRKRDCMQYGSWAGLSMTSTAAWYTF